MMLCRGTFDRFSLIMCHQSWDKSLKAYRLRHSLRVFTINPVFDITLKWTLDSGSLSRRYACKVIFFSLHSHYKGLIQNGESAFEVSLQHGPLVRQHGQPLRHGRGHVVLGHGRHQGM